MNTKRFLTVAALCLSSFFLSAQELELSERWLMNERLLDLVDSYERFSAMEGRSDAFSFLALFRTPESPVWCDYITSSEFGKAIPAKRYVEYSKELEDRSLKISRVHRKSDLAYRDGRWRASVEFRKEVEYEDSLGFTFSTRSRLLGGDFGIVLNCVWMPDQEEFLIESVDGQQLYPSKFPKGNFHIVEKKNEIDSRVLYGGEPLEFNEYGFAIVTDGQEFGFDDDDIVLQTVSRPGTERYDVLRFDARVKRWRARIHGTYSPVYSVTAPNYVDANTGLGSLGVGLGGEIGYSLFGGRSTKVVVYTGMGIYYNQIGLALKDKSNISYNYLNENFSVSAASEQVGVLDMSILLPMFSIEHNFSKKWCGVLDFGASWNLPVKLFQDPYTVSFNMNGRDYKDVQFDRFLDPNRNEVSWSTSLFGKVGADFAFASCKYLYLRVGYEYALGYTYNPAQPAEWYSPKNSMYPLVSSVNAAGQTEAVAVHSFISNVSLRRSGFIGELGVRFKF